MVPAPAWAALATATGTDTQTREAFIAALGLRRVMIGHVLAAMVVGVVADLAVFGIAVGTRVMSPQPSVHQWAAAVMAAGAGLVSSPSIRL